MKHLALLAVIFGIIWSSGAMAGQVMSAPEARAAALEERIVIVDIRSPEEWRATGIPDQAVPTTMHDREFLANLDTLIAQNPEKPIALLCATGGRTAFVVRELEKRGYNGLIDISEGMEGSEDGPGWRARNLPIKQP